MVIGKIVQQSSGYKAFIPEKFPPRETIILNSRTQKLHAKAALMLGKLDGITQLLPDLDFFILMYIRKEAAKSSKYDFHVSHHGVEEDYGTEAIKRMFLLRTDRETN